MNTGGQEYIDPEGNLKWKRFFNTAIAIIMAGVILTLGANIKEISAWVMSHIPFHPGHKAAKPVPPGFYGSWTRITDAKRTQILDISPVSDTAFYLNEHQENDHVNYTLAGTGHFYEPNEAVVKVKRDYLNCKVDLYYIIDLTSDTTIDVKARPVDFSSINQCELNTASLNVSGALSFTKASN